MYVSDGRASKKHIPKEQAIENSAHQSNKQIIKIEFIIADIDAIEFREGSNWITASI